MAEPGSRRGFVVLAVLIIAAIGAGALYSGCLSGGGGTGTATGTLTGNVSIGPLCPVEPCSISHDRILTAYAARPITIATPSGAVVMKFTADPDTGYAIPLQPGNYVVDIPHTGVGGSRELPATVTIRSGQVTWLNISIDTGIR